MDILNSCELPITFLLIKLSTLTGPEGTTSLAFPAGFFFINGLSLSLRGLSRPNFESKEFIFDPDYD